MTDQNPSQQPGPGSNPWQPVPPGDQSPMPAYGADPYSGPGQQSGPGPISGPVPGPQPYQGQPYGGQPYPGQPYPAGGWAQPGMPGPSSYPGGHPPAGDPGTLDLPYYGIGFVEGVQRAYRKYARFDGRASRSEYWWFMLGTFIVEIVLMVLFVLVAATTTTHQELGAGAIVLGVVWFLFALGSFVPILAITMRRLHDQNQSGGLAALMFVPYVGGLITMILAIQPSNPQGARYDQFRDRPAPGNAPYPG